MHKIGDQIEFCPSGKGDHESPTKGVVVAIVEPGQDSLPFIEQWYADNVASKHRDVAMLKAVLSGVAFSFTSIRYLVVSQNELGQREWHSVEVDSSSAPPVAQPTEQLVEGKAIVRKWELMGGLVACEPGVEAVFCKGKVDGAFRRDKFGCLVDVLELPVVLWGSCSLVARNSKGQRVEPIVDAPIAICGFYFAGKLGVQCVENWQMHSESEFLGYKLPNKSLCQFLGEPSPIKYLDEQRKKSSSDNKEST